ncbi:MAG: asparagine synthase C-terminal domain-containing protein, partial [Pirellulaceae bacterium]|nr:asparagine synthase C-terminal domain-containing protein [Pirellulaceae bacterium]
LNSLSPAAWDRIYHFGPWKKRHALLGDKIQKIAKLLPSKDASLLYRSLCSQWQNPEKVVLGVESDFIIDNFNQSIGSDIKLYAQWLKLRDFQTYLAGDILVKVDRASMAVGLEARSPLLDHQLVEWAWSLPIEMNIRHGVGKSLLRQVLYKHVPQRLIDRPKMGFGVPIVHWLRKELKDWAAALLDEKRLKHEGYFDPKPIVDLWKQHQSGARNVQHQLWTVLMFQSWLETQNAAPF